MFRDAPKQHLMYPWIWSFLDSAPQILVYGESRIKYINPQNPLGKHTFPPWFPTHTHQEVCLSITLNRMLSVTQFLRKCGWEITNFSIKTTDQHACLKAFPLSTDAFKGPESQGAGRRQFTASTPSAPRGGFRRDTRCSWIVRVLYNDFKVCPLKSIWKALTI